MEPAPGVAGRAEALHFRGEEAQLELVQLDALAPDLLDQRLEEQLAVFAAKCPALRGALEAGEQRGEGLGLDSVEDVGAEPVPLDRVW